MMGGGTYDFHVLALSSGRHELYPGAMWEMNTESKSLVLYPSWLAGSDLLVAQGQCGRMKLKL